MVRCGVDEEHQLLEELGLHENFLLPSNRSMLRHIRTLRSLAEDGSLPVFSQARPEDTPVQFQEVFEAYSSHLEQRGLARATRRGQVSVIRKFLTGLTIAHFGEVSMGDVTAHIEACSWMTAQTRSGILYMLPAFTKWAAEEGFCSPDVAAATPVIPGHKHASLPSAYAVKEVAAMVAATAGQCPQCDRAMQLLSSVLGMRTGDIRMLQLNDIDWRAHEIWFRQVKTGNPVRLPLPAEVMLALADYLRNELPHSTNEHVFLQHRTPHDSFEDASNSFYYVATGAFGRASVSTVGKHHGMHSVRHSAATNMLSDAHQTLQRFLDANRPAPLAALHHRITMFREHYNHRRPHQALGDATPKSAWELLEHTPATEPIALVVLEAKAAQYIAARR